MPNPLLARVYWTDNKTGASGVYTEKTGSIYENKDWNEGYSCYWWSEGNASCDCNRSIFFLGTDYGDSECGESRFAIEKIEALDQNGSVVVTFNKEHFKRK